jgi:hypothetical protein
VDIMTQATVSRVRRKVRVFAFVVPFLALVALAGACGEQKRAEGDECLKDPDCLSGYCVQLHCGSAPPYVDAEVNADGTAPDAAGEASSQDGPGVDAPSEAAVEAGGGSDAPADAPQGGG